MGAASESRTSATLLARLRQVPPDQAAWGEFAERYGRKIYGWCRQWNLQEADAEDVTQAVLLRLTEKMQDFDYDPARSFRAWLKTVTRHAWSDFWDSRKRAGLAGGSEVWDRLQSAEAREDLVERLDDEFDREVLDEALGRVRGRVAPRTWRAFELMAFAGWSGAAAARELGMKVAMAFVAKSRVQRLVQEEVQKLEGRSQHE
jgi:RNA polymerase sigma-70 factor (ECF subfamily)